MISWIADNAATITICLVICAVLACVIRTMVKNRRAGKSACGCGCSSCAMAGSCHGNDNKRLS